MCYQQLIHYDVDAMAGISPVVRHNRGSIPRATKPCCKRLLELMVLAPLKIFALTTINLCSEFPSSSLKSN
jgi:hypothetical protein